MLPKDTFEAAIIDGATRFQKTIYVTLPLLKETIKISAVMIIISAFNSFQTVKILTNGEPRNMSHVITSYIYRIEFTTFDFGKGSALSMLLFIIIMAFAISTLVMTRKRYCLLYVSGRQRSTNNGFVDDILFHDDGAWEINRRHIRS